MKRTFIIVPLLALIFGAASVHADTKVTASSTKKSEIEQKKAEVKKVVEDKKAEIKDIRKEFQADRAKGLVTRAVDELTRTADRLTKLADRVASRIVKIKAAGGDTTKSETSLLAARADIAKARTQIAGLATVNLTVASGTASTTIKANFEKVKTAADAVKLTFQSAKKNLELSVSSLKGPHATSTGTSTKATETR